MANLQVRVPPHSDDAEVSVLGALLLDKDAIITIAEFLLPDHFYNQNHSEIYEAILELFEDRVPVDVLTVSDKLTKRKSLKQVGGRAYLADLANKVPTAAHVEHYAKIVKDTATKRNMMTAAAKLVDLSLDEALTAEELLDKAEAHVFGLTQKHLTQGFIPVKAALADAFDRLDELHKLGTGLRGIPTGFKSLDNVTAGFQKSNLIILAGRPGGGKCVSGDTLIVNPETGRRQTIESIVLQKTGKILTLNEDFKFIKTSPSAFVDDGFKPVYEIKTSLGNRLEATAVHPLLTIGGWKKVEDIKEGERIAVPRQMDVFGSKHWEDWKVKSLAYLLGDGGVTASSPRFTNGNPIVLADFCNSVAKFSGVTTTYAKQSKLKLRTPTVTVINKNPYKKELREIFSKKLSSWLVEMGWSQRKLALNVGVSPATLNLWVSGNTLPGQFNYPKLEAILGETVERVDRNNPVTVWLTSLEVMGKLAIEKEIPSEIFELNKNNTKLFINRLYACEGSVILPGDGKGSGRISFASSSYKLAEGMRHLLLRFGILARLRSKKVKYRGGLKDAYELEIKGANNILTFVKEIGIFGKEKKIKQIEQLAKSKEFAKNFSKDTLPLEIWKLVVQEKGDLSWRGLYKKMGRPLSHNIHVYKRQLKRDTLKEVALALNSQKLLNLAQSDVFWDKVVSIKPNGLKNVFDLSVVETHNFIANDIVVHNTSFVLNVAQNLAVVHKKPVAIFTLEMSKEELVDRLLVAQADIDAWKLKTGKLNADDFTKLSNAMGELAEAPLYIDDMPAQTILEMRTKARRLQVEHGIDLLIVDYLQLAQGRNKDNRVLEVGEISQGLKNLARELKIPVLACAQLSRAVESRDIKRPQLSDLRESGSIEQDADLVMFLWPENDDDRSQIVLDIAKHRNGALAQIKLFFKGERTRFYERELNQKAA